MEPRVVACVFDPSTRRQHISVNRGQSDLHSEFQAIRGHTVRSYLKKAKGKEGEKTLSLSSCAVPQGLGRCGRRQLWPSSALEESQGVQGWLTSG